jgi:hypothetical protein
MKPLLSDSDDSQALQALGRASVQIVHDLKNQLNGLKLYATFLRKRLEKSDRPKDELETVNKLIGGLDRTAADLSLLVEYGRPIPLKKQPGVDLGRLVRDAAESVNLNPPTSGSLVGKWIVNCEATPLVGEFDSNTLSEALRSISTGARKMVDNKNRQAPLEISLKSELQGQKRNGVIEWRTLQALDHDPFISFAGRDEIRMSLAARIIEEHGGSATREDHTLRVTLPLSQ